MRRTRYSFVSTRPDGTRDRQDVLTYASQGGARKLLESDGHTNIEDWVPMPASFEVDRCALDDARELLRLRFPIKLSIRHNRSCYGSHRVSFDQNVHRICLDAGMDWIDAGRTLWHELEHARQYEADLERIGVAGVRAEANAAKHTPRWFRQCEREARARESMNNELPLCREVSHA